MSCGFPVGCNGELGWWAIISSAYSATVAPSGKYATALMIFAGVSGCLSVAMRCPWVATKEKRMVASVECAGE